MIVNFYLMSFNFVKILINVFRFVMFTPNRNEHCKTQLLPQSWKLVQGNFMEFCLCVASQKLLLNSLNFYFRENYWKLSNFLIWDYTGRALSKRFFSSSYDSFSTKLFLDVTLRKVTSRNLKSKKLQSDWNLTLWPLGKWKIPLSWKWLIV